MEINIDEEMQEIDKKLNNLDDSINQVKNKLNQLIDEKNRTLGEYRFLERKKQQSQLLEKAKADKENNPSNE